LEQTLDKKEMLSLIRTREDMDFIKSQIEKLQIPATVSRKWQIGTLVGLIVLMTYYFSISSWYSNTYAQYRSTPSSINQLLTIRRHVLDTAISPLTPTTNSVCALITAKRGVYGQLDISKNAMVNWRPLTVRLTGCLGGINTIRDGVFDMTKGVQLALSQGARAFVFEIDYLENSPCNPVVIHRDGKGYMRSLHTGSVKEGCKALADMSFTSNYDPVLVILYFRRIPPGTLQQSSYFKKTAASLEPLTKYHLGSNEQGNFHNCRSEANLFMSPITNYQKKFIVLTNYNTNLLPSTQNPKDNLDFWTNARIYVDESGKSSTLGTVTTTVPQGQIPFVQVGSSQQLLAIPTVDRANYLQTSSHTFKIVMSDIEYTFSSAELSTLMNTLGIQCVPIDVLTLAAKDCHAATLQNTNGPSQLTDLSNPTNPKDQLSFWKHAGWSRKLIIEGFDNPVPVPPAAKIPGFIIPPVVVPKRPPPNVNSNGGLVNIG